MTAAEQDEAPGNAGNTRQAELDSGKESVQAAYRNLLEAKEHFRHAAQAAGLELKDEAAEQWLKGQEKADELGEQVTRYMRERPFATLGIAFATGYLLSQLLSRR